MGYKIKKELGSGAVSNAFLLEDGRVIIIGNRGDSFNNYKALCNKMSALKEITSVKYPKIHELIFPCEEYPYGAMIEDYVCGEELVKVNKRLTKIQKYEIGKALAKFITELHNNKVAGNKEEEININLWKFDRSFKILEDYLDKNLSSKLMQIKQEYKKLMESKDFCVTHGDLNAGNIMVDENGVLSGVIDFGNTEYYLPEIEFVHMYFFDKTIYNAMVENYCKSINDKEIVLLELVVNIRHFKNILNVEDKRIASLNNIKKLLELYLEIK